jgi:hypothetical protein
MTVRLRKLFILGTTLALMVLTFAIGISVGGWVSGHQPELWTLALPCVAALFGFGLLFIVVSGDAPP